MRWEKKSQFPECNGRKGGPRSQAASPGQGQATLVGNFRFLEARQVICSAAVVRRCGCTWLAWGGVMG